MKEVDSIDLDSLFDEVSLWQIYKNAPSFFTNKFNTWTLLIVFFLLSSFSSLHACCKHIYQAYPINFIELYGSWANAGIALSSTTLGFLIAGFAVICTVLRPQTVLALQGMQNHEYNLTKFKLFLAQFIEVMVQYLALLIVSILALVFGNKGGPISFAGHLLRQIHWVLPSIAAHVIYTCWGSFFVMVILTLKSFVYNLYSTLVLGMAHSAHDYQTQELSKLKQADPQNGQHPAP